MTWCAATLFIAAFSVASCSARKESTHKDGAGAKKSNEPLTPDTSSSKPDISSDASSSSCTKGAVIFHHGFMGGNKMGSFVGVVPHFERLGCKVYRTEVSAVASVEERGKQLAAQVQKIAEAAKGGKVSIIAHSQGGLDARYAISTLGLAPVVASLTTLSTPHFGTQVADMAQSASSGPLMQKSMEGLLKMMAGFANTQDPASSNAAAAIQSLSTRYVHDHFNPSNKDSPEVYYQSWGARSGKGTPDKIKTMLAVSNTLLRSKSGENDGMVPVESSKWGSFRGVLDADHLDLIGLKLGDGPSPFDHLKFLTQTVAELSAKGY